ncbi:MAG: protein phosphatase 2C domain-containing protein [Rhodobacteraceae bacterium]|nr:MAG: protein phosphatase 2C domain-containing protein [Paracoccaceae bacterium]
MARPALAPEPAICGWTVAAATRRGESHARRGERGQDAARVLLDGPTLIAVVSDGAGSAPRGGAGAALACRVVAEAARAAVAAAGSVGALADDAPAAWLAAARARIAFAATARDLRPRDFAATLALAVSDGVDTLVAHVGDGAVVGRDADGWRALSWPDGGEHAGATFFLTDENPALRVIRAEAPVDALALLTDGIERLVLDFAALEPHAPFFDRMTAPLATAAPGRDAALGRALAAWLGAEAVAARTDDDRTLVLALRR